MQGGQHQVAGFGSENGGGDGFQVAHFADQDDVRVLAQRSAQRGGERCGVHFHFALVDEPFLSRCRYSIGSSMVMMCSERRELIRSIMAASVVDLPEPVVPVVRIRPRCSSQTVERMRGSSSSSMVRIFVGMTRRTMPTLPRCWKTLTRKRPRPATPYAMSSSAVSLNFCFWRLVIMLKAIESISSGVMRGTSLSGFRMPSTRR